MRVAARAKINLALVVGGLRADGRHDVATVLQRISLADEVEIERGDGLSVGGFADDTLVREALSLLASAAGIEPRWRVRIGKRIPVAAGLGGGSSDAAAALVAANDELGSPLDAVELARLAAAIGVDVPFFLTPGPKLAHGAGELLAPVDLPQDYWVVVALPRGARKRSTADVYRRFDELGGSPGFEGRRRALLEAVERRDLVAFPPNDLAEAAGRPGTLLDALRAAEAFRADVTGAGPAVYGLFVGGAEAERAAASVAAEAEAWVARPVW